MTFAQTLILGAIAGLTIYLGLPLGRVRGLSARMRTFLSMTSAGILIFLLIEIFHQIAEPIEELLLEAPGAPGGYGRFGGMVLLFMAGFGLGLIGLYAFERRFIKRGAAAPALNPQRLSLLIAGGIGLHNFSEGLAIGQSSAQLQLALMSLLVVGFALHNATEGLGIIGPLAGARPSWGFLALAGLIGGGPTFVGSVVGYYLASPLMFTFSLALAGGALVYLIGELFNQARSPLVRMAAGWGVFSGLFIAFLTELVLAAAGF